MFEQKGSNSASSTTTSTTTSSAVGGVATTISGGAGGVQSYNSPTTIDIGLTGQNAVDVLTEFMASVNGGIAALGDMFGVQEGVAQNESLAFAQAGASQAGSYQAAMGQLAQAQISLGQTSGGSSSGDTAALQQSNTLAIITVIAVLVALFWK